VNKHLYFAEKLTYLLENRFSFFGMRFGLDPIIGIIPGIGDILPLLLSLYIVWIGLTLRLPSHKIAAMMRNIMLDFLIGSIPFIGDVADVLYRSNTKNLSILESHFSSSSSIEEGVLLSSN